MEVTRFAEFVDQRVYVDTNAFVYFLERHREFYDRVLPLFEAAAQGKLQLVTSELTIAEMLVQPYKMRRADIAATSRRF
jgi:predicted nucleic acid-binding protein